tara:strand:- start:21 stop:191 length:171 start_codon:yes stop_codon:yes gene_type:complete
MKNNLGIPKNPINTETGRIYWHDNKTGKALMKDIDGKVYELNNAMDDFFKTDEHTT